MTAAHKPAAPAPPRRASGAARVARALLWALPALVVLLIAAASALAWLGRTDDGAAWLLARVPGLTSSPPRGSLWRTLEIDRVELALPGGAPQDRVVLRGVHWQGLSFGRATHAPLWLTLSLAHLHIERIDVERAPAPEAPHPRRLPSSLALPVGLSLPDVRIGAIYASALGERPLRALHAAVQLGTLADDGRELHRIEQLSLEYDRLALHGTASIASQAPFDVAAQIALAPSAGRIGPVQDFDASLRLSGPLDWLNLIATLRGRSATGRPAAEAQALDLKATLLPFAAWPIGALEAHTRALDLSALSSALPATALTGSATLASDAATQPANLVLAFDNARAGRIDEGLLPVTALHAEARARPDDLQQIELHAIDAKLGSAQQPAGRVQGSGRWDAGSAGLELQLAELRPDRLDARAPAMRLGGTATLHADGLMDAAAPPRFALQGRIDGALPVGARERRVQLRLDAAGTATQIVVREALAQAGASQASLSGRAEREGDGWRLRAKGGVADLDPSLWWPGAEGSAWRRGPHRLNARLDADLRLAGEAAGVSGHARIDLDRSVLAGVPLAGRIALDGGTSGPLAIDARLDVAGAKVTGSGRTDARRAANDHWQLEVEDAQLARFAPLLRLAQPNAQPPALAGRLDLRGTVDGRWPALATRGTARLAEARAGDVRLGQASASWRLALGDAEAPLELDAKLGDVAFGSAPGPTLSSARLQLQGTLAAHRIELDASSPARPPTWVDALQGAPAAAAAGSTLALRAQGGASFDPKALATRPLQWRGRVQRLELQPGGNAAPWLATSDVGLELAYAPKSGLARVELAPGRLQGPGGAALRWSELRWQGGAQPALDLRAEIEPLEVAPLLARLQPDFGWRGDLRVAGRIDVHRTTRFTAAIEIERRDGDLAVRETSTSALALGLTDLRLALDAQGGVWNFTAAFAGKTLGAMAAAATARTGAGEPWPPAEAPLAGVLEASVANLGTWGAWVPAGWRLGGKLHASASIAGRFGAPLYTGRVEGQQLAVRNLLEGIDLHDGELALSLQGETARIETFEAHAGDGRVSVSGGASFGARPTAQLQLVAERLLLLGRVDRRVVASGRAQLRLASDSIAVDGGFAVDEGLIDISQASAPRLGDDVRVMRPQAKPAPPAGTGAPRRLALDLRLDLGRELHLRGRGIDTLLRGELAFTSPADKLLVTGTIRTAEGHYAAYGQKLDVEHGLIVFNGALDNPRLDILAIRPDLDVRVGVAISGTAQSPRVRLVSEPDMPEIDKLSWLVLGHAAEANGGSDLALLQRAAFGLLQGEKGGAGLTQRLGLDALSVRPGDGESKETIVSLGKQLTQRWYVGYERGLNATAGTWQLIYRIAQRFTLRAQSGLDNSLDLIWTWRWQ